MCGFSGFLGGRLDDELGAAPVLQQMGAAIIHRGPDDFGSWFSGEGPIGLVHRRLSILDLSAAGHQPMISDSGRYVIAFNGEIYNHLELRELLGYHVWRGHSDTETLLAGIEHWGVAGTLTKSIGMFAFALWDRQLQVLTLARDRMGEKPLYFGWQGQGQQRSFLFGSDLAALKRHPVFVGDINRDALCLFLRHNYIPAPYSIFRNIEKLEPGCILTVSLAQPDAKIEKYWDLLSVAQGGRNRPFSGSRSDAVEELERTAKDAVQKQMISDVPLGAFLSGGLDSSTVVALMQSQSSAAVKTFTIGFDESGYNEACHAKAIANHLGTSHTEWYISPREAIDVIPLMPGFYSEPFADSSQIPTYLVSKLARQHVSVSLSGDGGDELFCGYNRYDLSNRLWGRLSLIPGFCRSLVASGIKSISPGKWNQCAQYLPYARNYSFVGHKLHKGAGVLTSRNPDELYLRIVSHVHNPEDWVVGGAEPVTQLTQPHSELNGFGYVERMMTLDAVSYLPDDILVKLDRATMGVSLEGRIPFLDHRVVEFACSLPLNYKLNDGKTKWPLRQVLYKYVPESLMDRPKMGFGIPLNDWLRGPLRDWAEGLLQESRLSNEGFFQPELVRAIWAEHLTGTQNWSALLWNILMFQAWFDSTCRVGHTQVQNDRMQ